jgi:hypothetical protein
MPSQQALTTPGDGERPGTPGQRHTEHQLDRPDELPHHPDHPAAPAPARAAEPETPLPRPDEPLHLHHRLAAGDPAPIGASKNPSQPRVLLGQLTQQRDGQVDADIPGVGAELGLSLQAKGETDRGRKVVETRISLQQSLQAGPAVLTVIDPQRQLGAELDVAAADPVRFLLHRLLVLSLVGVPARR